MIKLSRILIGFCFVLMLSSATVVAAEKPRVIVVDFAIQQKGGWWAGGSGHSTASVWATHLAKADFEVVHRSQLEVAAARAGLRMPERLTVAEATRLGKLVDAQYIMNGTVTGYSQGKSDKEGMLNLGECRIGGKAAAVRVALDLSVVELASGRTLYSRSMEEDQTERGTMVSCPWFTGSTADKTPAGLLVRDLLKDASKYFECVMITQTPRCLNKFH